MEKEKVLRIVSVIIFLIGLICVGGVVYFIIWRLAMEPWNHFYTWLLIIGIPCFIIGVIMVNKYLKNP
ncbi:MAG TPA: hypothetical protein VMV49_14650 [Candidatus Deferrimicrobium sp.]|nr:hypothetical protein [Candidatus Deferrimicrobium sp.]